ncbi:D-malate degradation protein R [Cognatishimia activa]|uniref:D-malate degradation protein R n=2 Tax=Cognatishimia activa TaxID=1715691 RepID=A0A0P1IPS8_9RHOB|nr:D-malate degradation protein R [Cognatishimia activa]CUK25541.1 D-malate degradation protein R [Cognatishimia activa]
MMVFAKVAQTRSFTAAADALGIGRSVVSSHVSQLERNLDMKLLIRSTRSLSLTSQGQILFESCGCIAREIEVVQERLDAQHSEAAGNIRMTCSVNLGTGVFSGMLAEFQRNHPEITIEMILEDRMADVVEEGFDLAVRTGWKDDGRLRLIKLPTPRILICAAQEWVKQNPEIKSPGDLCNVPWVQTSLSTPTGKLRLRHRSGTKKQIEVTPVFSTNAGLAAKLAIIAGAGVGLLPDFAIQEELHKGTIISLLPQWTEEKDHPLSVVVPNQATQSRRVQLLIEFIKTNIQRTHISGDSPKYPRH